MATFGNGVTISCIAAADLNSYQYHMVTTAGSESGSANYVNVASSGCNPAPIGILQNDPDTGQGAGVMVLGKSLLVCNGAGSTIYMGRFLNCGSDGHGEPMDYSGACVAHAYSLDHATGDGVTISVMFMPHIGAWAESGS